jgi:dihydroxyacetone kinase-like protein
MLSPHQLRQALLHVSIKMQESRDLLTQADKVIGDGDHGIGMARGFEAVQRRLEADNSDTVGEIFGAVGMALLTSVGGAAGAIFGLFFRGGSANLAAETVFNSPALASLLEEGLRTVQERGQARPGDKTMVDALEPAAARAKELAALPLGESITAVAEAARQGMESTKEMTARVGKAKTLGDRSLGYADPGAISLSLILSFMAEHVTGLT